MSPPVAFLLYLLFGSVLWGAGRLLAGPSQANAVKSSTYASGEAPPNGKAILGYRPFFLVALFFAVLHLGVLIVGSGNHSGVASVYLVGLLLTLLALLLS